MSNLQIEEKLFNIENSIQKLNLAVKPILSVEEAAAFLNMKPSYLYKLTSDKRITFFKPLGKLIYLNELISKISYFAMKVFQLASNNQMKTIGKNKHNHYSYQL